LKIHVWNKFRKKSMDVSHVNIDIYMYEKEIQNDDKVLFILKMNNRKHAHSLMFLFRTNHVS